MAPQEISYIIHETVPEVGSYTRNKTVKYQIGKLSYSWFILAGIRKTKVGNKKKYPQASDFHLDILVRDNF